jgi:hypothetical protein
MYAPRRRHDAATFEQVCERRGGDLNAADVQTVGL